MDKMLKDKYSMLRELKKGKGDINLEDIRTGLLGMLSNLRFQDGRSLEEVYKNQMVDDRIKKEQAKLEELDNVSEDMQSSNDDSDDRSVEVSEHESQKDIENEQPESDVEEGEEIISDPALYDDLLKAREQFKIKRNLFETQLDPSLSQEDTDLILSRYDDQMAKLEKELVKDQEDQANSLKAKLAARQKLNKQVVDVANDEISHTVGQMTDL